MNKTVITVFCLIFTAILLGYNSRVFSVELFGLFSSSGSASDDLQKIRDFNPDRDMFYLPDLDDKGFFESVDDLSICRRSEVREYLYKYLTSGRDYTIKAIERSYYYMPIITGIMKKNPDLPEDIALLPLLESGFNPEAVSKSNAVGLWQFLKGTSSHLGLKNDRWTDERRDIEKSTEAAIRHLRYLHKRFGRWDLALAAYNGGCGHVSRAMKRTGAKDFWSLRKSGALSYETSEYVPRYAALMIIYRNRRLSGLAGEINIPPVKAGDTVAIEYPVSVEHILRKYNISREFIRTYNPELKGDIIPSYSGTYYLRIPSDSVKDWEEGRTELYTKK